MIRLVLHIRFVLVKYFDICSLYSSVDISVLSLTVRDAKMFKAVSKIWLPAAPELLLYVVKSTF